MLTENIFDIRRVDSYQFVINTKYCRYQRSVIDRCYPSFIIEKSSEKNGDCNGKYTIPVEESLDFSLN